MPAPPGHFSHGSSSLFFGAGLFLQSLLSCLPLTLAPPAFLIPPAAHPPHQSSQTPLTVLDVFVPTEHLGLDLSPLWRPSGKTCSSSRPPHRQAGYQVGLRGEAELGRGRMVPGLSLRPAGKPTRRAGRGGRVLGPQPPSPAARPELQGVLPSHT